MKSASPEDSRAGGGELSAAGSRFGARRSRSLEIRAGRVAAAIAAVAASLLGAGPAAAQDPGAAGAAPPPVVIDSVIVRGLVRQPEAVVRAEIGIRSGDTITIRTVQRAERRLWSSGNYRDVQVRIIESEGSPGAPVDIVFELAEQPFIGEIVFEGLENVRPSVIRDTVGLRVRMPYQPARAAEAEAMIRKMLGDKGIRVAELSHRIEEIPDRPGEFRLHFDVTEGHRISIAEVDFVGNSVFPTERLRKVIDTKAEGFFWFRGGEFDEEKLRADLREKLPEFYAQNGYIDFVVVGDSMVVDPETGKARLIIEVNEGDQYRLADFEIDGNKRFAAEDLRQYFERDRGGILSGFGLGGGTRSTTGTPVFDQRAFMEATDDVRRLYNNNGYLYAQVEPVIERVTTDDGEKRVRVSWQIREGEPAYVNRVTIRGNTFTHEDVIRERIYLLPGDVYNEQLLIQSYQSIMALGFFETPLPMPKIEPNEHGDVNITFEVKEKQTGSINFGTAVGGGTGLAGFLGYDQPNLFGQAKAGHLRWEFGRYSNNLEASYSDPAIFGSRTSGAVSLFSARDRFFQFAEGQRRRTGAGLRFGFPLPVDRFSRFNLGYSLSRTTYEQFDQHQTSSLFSLPPGVQSTLTLGVARNTLDHPMFPTSGTRQQIEAALSGGLLGGDGHFQKYIVGGSWYVPVGQVGGKQPGTRPIRFTLGLNAEAGTLFGDATRFPFERFWMGGVQFGQPLRGYDETTVTPSGYRPRGIGSLEDRFGDAYLRLSAEYAVRFNDNLSLSLFYDAGNTWRKPGEMNPTKLLRGAGIGVMLVTPFGPLGLDYAYGFDRTDPGWQLHFKLGPGF